MSDFLIGAAVAAVVLIGLFMFTNTRSFGVYQNGTCAYEKIEGGKASCPKVLPDRYNSHIVSPDYSQTRDWEDYSNIGENK